MLDLRLGGRRTPLYGEPVALRARVLRYTDGVFVNSGPMETGLAVHCGPTVVLAVGAAQLIVTTHVAPCNDRPFRSAWHRPGAHPPAVREGQEPFPRRLRRPVPAHRGYRCAGAGDAGFARAQADGWRGGRRLARTAPICLFSKIDN